MNHVSDARDFRLPASRIPIRVRQPNGLDDLALMEASADGVALALDVAARLIESASNVPIEWGNAPATDLDAALLRIRQVTFGDEIQSDAACPGDQCRARVDIAFHISDYLKRNAPRLARQVKPGDAAGWFQLGDIRFRLPSCGDRVAVLTHSHPERELRRRCIEPADVPVGQLRRIETAMKALAPNLAQELDGRCPECGTSIRVHFDPQQFTLREMRDHAAFIYEDIHLLAQNYHWPENEILALPRDRRIRYVEMVRSATSAA